MAQTFDEWWQAYRYEVIIRRDETLRSALETAYLAGKEFGCLQGVREAQEKAKDVSRIHAVGGFLTEAHVLDGHPQRRWVPSTIPLEDVGVPATPQAYY